MSGMMRCLATVMAGTLSIQAQGGSSIITLVMPPPGSEGLSALDFGGNFADGATSAYYNPALLSDLERSTGSQVHFATGIQNLLPVLGNPELRQTFQGLAAVLPDSAGGTDFGFGWYRNRVEFGRSNSSWGPPDFLSHETVTALALGIRLGFPASLGVAAKFFESRLTPDNPAFPGFDGTAHGFAFDAGMLLNPRFSPPSDWEMPYLEVLPSLSLTLRNLGPDAFYLDPDHADPIPTTSAVGAGLKARLADYMEVGIAWSQEAEVHRRAGRGLVDYRGYSVGSLFYRFSQGWLDDPVGRRWEQHTAHALEADMLRAFRLLGRLRRGDFRSPSRSFDEGFAFAPVRVLGQAYRANPRVSMGWRRIDGRDGGLRQGQKAWFIALSI